MKKARYLPFALREPWLLAGAIAAIAALLIALGANPFASLDRRWFDYLVQQRLQWGLAPKPDARVFLVDLESEDFMGAASTAAEYNMYADIVNILSDFEVKAVAFDLMLARGTAEDSRGVLAALRKSGNVVLAEAWEQTKLRQSFPAFAPGEFFSGLINISMDPDGVHRRYSYGATVGQCRPSLALAAYLRYMDIAQTALHCTDTGELAWKELGADQSSVVERGLPSRNVLLNWRAPFSERWDRGFKYLTVRDLRTRHAEWTKHKDEPAKWPKGIPEKGDIVMVGSIAIGTGDAGPTPFAKFEPLMQLHANALNDLLQSLLLTELSPWWTALLTVAGLLSIAAAGRFAEGNLLFFLASAFVLAILFAGSGAMLHWHRAVVAVITPAGFVVAGLLVESARRTGVESFEKAKTKETLGRYFSPRVLEDVLKNPDAMLPREATITVLLTDVRNFTTITERFGADLMFRLLNDMFEVETKTILDLDGSMEHFVGDQFLAYWGAPNAQPDAADRALEAARRIITGLEAVQATLEPDVKKLFGYGVAIHTGKALFGNKGSQRRLDYGILGDIVNSAARVEGLTKHYLVRQIITKEVFELATSKEQCRFLDRIRVKGKGEPLEMYEVLQDLSEQHVTVARLYEKAWKIYESGRFADARAALQQLATTDKPSALLLHRCEELIANPPTKWDGAYQFTEK